MLLSPHHVIITCVFIFITPYCISQNRKKNSSNEAGRKNEKILEKWSKAVISLEGRSTYDTWIEDEAEKKHRNGEMTFEEKERIKYEEFNRHRYVGTGVYFTNNGNKYIITARHVIEDTSSFHRQENYYDKVYDNILIVDRIDSVKRTTTWEASAQLHGLNAGLPSTTPFVFSSKEDDIAIINLSKSTITERVLKYLEENGYEPITYADIDTLCILKAGDLLKTIGFPSDYAFKAKNIDPSMRFFTSDVESIPVVSEGAVYDPRLDSADFFSNIFIIPGNSGGPILKENKLVGLCHGYRGLLRRLSTDTFKFYLQRVSVFKKTSLIPELLRELDKRPKGF